MARARIRSKRGGARKLRSFERALKESPALLRGMSRAMAEEAVSKTLDRFREEKNPYGTPWRPKQVSDGRKVLSGKTSRLKGGWHVVKAGKGGFVIAPSVKYAAHHQFGTKRMPRRMMVPGGTRGLPQKYKKAFEEVAKDTLTAHFRNAAKTGGGGPGFIGFKIIGFKRRFAIRALFRKFVRAMSEE